MKDNVVILGGWTKVDLPPERVINAAQENEVNPVVIVGKDKDGELYFAATTSNTGEVLLLLERAKKRLIGLHD